MTSGTKTLLREAFSWAFLALLMAVALIHFQEIKAITAKFVDLPQYNGPTTTTVHKTTPPATARTEPSPAPYGTVRIRKGRGGHHYARAKINNRPINVVIDTGATLVAMTYEDARRAGIFVSPSDFTARSRTANGIARSARVTISELRINDISIRNVQASVSQPGALNVTLLGMSFLSRLSRVEMRNGDLILEK